MRVIKTLLVAGMALFLTLAAFGNITMPGGGFGAVQGALGMQTTFQPPNAMWRAIEAPALIWLTLGVIVALEIAGAVLCWIGAARLWAARGSAAEFRSAAGMAHLGLGLTACLYFIGFLAIANEYFLMWQSQELNVLQDAFRNFASAVLISIWLTIDTD